MSIAETIDQIIGRRKGTGVWEGKGRVHLVQKKLDFYKNLLEALKHFQNQREFVLKGISEQSGPYYAITASDPNFHDKITQASADGAIKKTQDAINELIHLINRFDRDTINISVIGLAGQGKSRLLQSVSGVDNAIIPADIGGGLHRC